MRAAVVRTPGEHPELGEHPDPTPGAGDTVVRVTAAPLVPLDLLCASGTSYFGRPAVPYVPGVQGVGVVESSPELPAGARVWFATSAGMRQASWLASYCAIRRSAALRFATSSAMRSGRCSRGVFRDAVSC